MLASARRPCVAGSLIETSRLAYREARQQAVQTAAAHLQGLLAKATDTLDRTLTCGSAAVVITGGLRYQGQK